MHVTVVICTWNRAELLRQTFEQMARLVSPTPHRWSLLVIDNNSTDATERVVREFASQLPIQSVFEPTPGLSNARNRAIIEASGDYLLWTDDDVLVDERWLVEFCAAADRHPSAAAIGGPIEPWFPVDPDPDLMEVFFWLRNGFCGLSSERPEEILPRGSFVWGANFALRRSAIGELRFDAALGPAAGMIGGGGDETHFLAALQQRGETIVWCPTLRVRHYVDPSRMSQKYLEGYTFQKGREAVLDGPDWGVPAFLGAPRWFWREWLTTSAKYLVSTLAPSPLPLPQTLRSGRKPARSLSHRVTRLTWCRERLFLQGMSRGFRERLSRGQVMSSNAIEPRTIMNSGETTGR